MTVTIDQANFDGITTALAQQQLGLWLQADADMASGGQVYSTEGTAVTRAMATEKIEYWQKVLRSLKGQPKMYGHPMR